MMRVTWAFDLLLVTLLSRNALPLHASGDETRSAEEKLNYLWSRVVSTKHSLSKLPTETYSLEEFLSGLANTDNILPIFSQMSDESLEARKKFVSTYGTTCRIQMEFFPNSPFSGIFEPGNVTGLARFSLAAYHKSPHDRYAPSIAFKIMIDGKPSENIMVIHTVDGQGRNNNWFLYEMSNIFIDNRPELFPKNVSYSAFVAAWKRIPYSDDEKIESVSNLALYELASVRMSGEKVSSVVAPYAITFWPNHEYDTDENSTEDFRVELSRIPSGSTLYYITAKETKGSTSDQLIGKVVTQSEMLSADFADQVMMFRHPIKRWKPAAAVRHEDL